MAQRKLPQSVMKRPNRLFLLCATLVALICGCKSKENTPEDAKLKDNIYTNRFFGFGMQIPKTWTFPEKPSKSEVKKGVNHLGLDQRMAAATAEAANQVHYLLISQESRSNTSLMLMAQDASKTPQIRTGKDYVDATLRMITGEGKPFQQVGQPGSARLGNLSFYGTTMTGNVLGRRQYQGMFVAIEKGYVVVMMVSAESEAGVDEVLTNVGVQVSRNEVAAKPKVRAPDPKWLSQVKLQGISGSDSRRLAIINGKTLAAGDTVKIKAATNAVTIRCVAIGDASVTVTMVGIEGERELHLAEKWAAAQE
jgi:hypothetical protein